MDRCNLFHVFYILGFILVKSWGAFAQVSSQDIVIPAKSRVSTHPYLSYRSIELYGQLQILQDTFDQYTVETILHDEVLFRANDSRQSFDRRSSYWAKIKLVNLTDTIQHYFLNSSGKCNFS